MKCLKIKIPTRIRSWASSNRAISLGSRAVITSQDSNSKAARSPAKVASKVAVKISRVRIANAV